VRAQNLPRISIHSLMKCQGVFSRVSLLKFWIHR